MKKLGELTPSRRRLVELMQDLNYGQIEDLHVLCGEPCFAPAPRVIQEIVFGKENGAHPLQGTPDFALKKQIVELFDRLQHAGDATIRSLVVQNGLPVRMKLEKPLRA